MRLVLFEPDIPQNAGTILRLAACFGVSVDMIEPFGFIFDEKRLRRSGMDYLDHVDIKRHSSWAAYCDSQQEGRLIVATTKGATRLDAFQFQSTDRILMGRESKGVTPAVMQAAHAAVKVPMQNHTRSLNVAVSCGIFLAEGLRQTGGFPV